MTISAQDDITVRKGRNWTKQYTFKNSDLTPIDLSDFTFQGQIRATAVETSALIIGFTFDLTNAATGIIIAKIDDSERVMTGNRGFFDIVGLDVSDEPWTYIFGNVKISNSPTVVV